MLQSVGFTTAINPNKKLLDKIAKEKLDCKIIIERKDVIYKLDEAKHGIYYSCESIYRKLLSKRRS